MYLPLLDRWLYRHPFEGTSARRYARDERPAFGDLDQRLLDRLALRGDERLLDVGCGPGDFARAAAARHPSLQIVALDPSRDYTWSGPARPNGHRMPQLVRGCGEQLPLADRSIDVAMLLSSIRHVHDRSATLRELRRVVRGRTFIVELDPEAGTTQVRNHADKLASPLLRRAFGPLVVRTAPPGRAIVALALEAGFRERAFERDPVQPVYIVELV